MKTVDSKAQLLEEAGYSYDFHRMSYVNRRTKKVFSVDFVDDHSEDELQRCFSEETNGGWRFYFNSDPSDAVKRKLENVLG